MTLITLTHEIELYDDPPPLAASLWPYADLRTGIVTIEVECFVYPGEEQTRDCPATATWAEPGDLHVVLGGHRYELPAWAWECIDWEHVSEQAIAQAEQQARDAWDESQERVYDHRREREW